MHIAVVNLTSGQFSGGYRKYLHAILPLLRDDSRVSRVDVFNPPSTSPAPEDNATGNLSWPDGDALRGFRVLRTRLRSLSPDVVFIPTARWLSLEIPTTVMIRNMEPLLVPFGGNTPTVAAQNLLRRHLARRACKRADRVVAVSGYVKDFIVSRWRIDRLRVGTVYHGVGPALSPEETHRPATISAGVKPMFFTAGSLRPARGLEDLVKALGHLRLDGITPTLIIAGETNPGSARYTTRIGRLARRLRVAEQLLWAGHLDEAEMGWCFRECAAFVMTSRAEACPNTALEAMSYGTVSVSADNQPMPEIFGDAAIYYPLGDSKTLARRLRSVIAERDAKVNDSIALKAEVRAGQFSWRETAQRTVAELMVCANGSKQ